MSHITAERKGDIAELHVASILLSDSALEVFVAACDDGHGSDLAVRSTRTARSYSVHVKATGPTADPFVSMKRFREAGDFIVAAVVLRDGLPDRTQLIPSSAWGPGAAQAAWVATSGGKATIRGCSDPRRSDRALGVRAPSGSSFLRKTHP